MAPRRLFYFKKVLEFQMETLKEYLEQNIESIKSKQEKLNVEFRTYQSAIKDDEDAQIFMDSFLDSNLKYYTDFPAYFNDSALMILYSFFESSFARICTLTKLDMNNVRAIKITASPRKSYASYSKSFLETECRFRLGAKNNVWKKIDRIRDYRNFIAHNNSNLKEAKDKVYKKATINYINRVFNKPLKGDSLEKYYIEDARFILTFLSLINNYLNFVIDKGIKKS